MNDLKGRTYLAGIGTPSSCTWVYGVCLGCRSQVDEAILSPWKDTMKENII